MFADQLFQIYDSMSLSEIHQLLPQLPGQAS